MHEDVSGNDTRVQKALREKLLTSFLEEIKDNGQWRKWLSPKGPVLYISAVCRELARREGTDTPIDASFFRGTGWGVQYKDDFNKWVISEMSLEQGQFSTVHDHTPVSQDPFKGEGFPSEAQKIATLTGEIKRMRKVIKNLEHQLSRKECKVLELTRDIESLISGSRERSKHYMFSIRSISYD